MVPRQKNTTELNIERPDPSKNFWTIEVASDGDITFYYIEGIDDKACPKYWLPCSGGNIEGFVANRVRTEKLWDCDGFSFKLKRAGGSGKPADPLRFTFAPAPGVSLRKFDFHFGMVSAYISLPPDIVPRSRKYAASYLKEIYGCEADVELKQVTDPEPAFDIILKKVSCVQPVDARTVVLLPPDRTDFTWRFPPDMTIAKAEEEIGRYLRFGNIIFVDQRNNRLQGHVMGEQWGSSVTEPIYIRRAGFEEAHVTVTYAGKSIRFPLLGKDSMNDLRRFVCREFHLLTVDLMVGDTILTDEHQLQPNMEITASVPEKCALFQFRDGTRLKRILEPEEILPVYECKTWIREQRPELTGMLALYYRGRILGDGLDVAKLRPGEIHVFHACMEDVDLSVHREMDIQRTVRLGKKELNLTIPARASVGAVLRAVVRASRSGRHAKALCLKVDGNVIPNSEIIKDLPYDRPFTVEVRNYKAERESLLTRLSAEERQAIGRMVEEAADPALDEGKLAAIYLRTKQMSDVHNYVERKSKQ